MLVDDEVGIPADRRRIVGAGAGKVDGAVAALDELAEIDGFKGVARYEKGRVYETAGDKDKAKATYHELLETLPSSPYKLDVERRLATL